MLTRWVVRSSLPVCWVVAIYVVGIQLLTAVFNPPVHWETLPRVLAYIGITVSLYAALGLLVGRWLGSIAAPSDSPTWEGAYVPWNLFGASKYRRRLLADGCSPAEMRDRLQILQASQGAANLWRALIIFTPNLLSLALSLISQPLTRTEAHPSLFGFALAVPFLVWPAALKHAFERRCRSSE
jgi:hypothetical protein